MISLESDYIQGAHEKILQRLSETNMEPLSGYGSDKYCEQAKEKIKKACECPQADIYFLVGGTQTNATVIDAVLQKYEGVVAAETGHISCHEAGAIEFTGHKVLEIPQELGKINAQVLEQYLNRFFADENHEHMVFPGMVYLSHPTEYGTLYTKQELEDISGVCNRYQIPLYLDGARLGYGLMSKDTDVALPDIARYCDVFYIGGTKVGALCGEAGILIKICNKLFVFFPNIHIFGFFFYYTNQQIIGQLVQIDFHLFSADGMVDILNENLVSQNCLKNL